MVGTSIKRKEFPPHKAKHRGKHKRRGPLLGRKMTDEPQSFADSVINKINILSRISLEGRLSLKITGDRWDQLIEIKWNKDKPQEPAVWGRGPHYTILVKMKLAEASNYPLFFRVSTFKKQIDRGIKKEESVDRDRPIEVISLFFLPEPGIFYKLTEKEVRACLGINSKEEVWFCNYTEFC